MKKEYRTYFGENFYKDSSGYWLCTKHRIPWAHRWVWINYHGEIPKGMDIHHKDGNKENNDISNLEMLSRSEHLKRHWKENLFDLDQRRNQLNIARQWLSTPEGRKRQSEDAKNAWLFRGTFDKECEECSDVYSTYMSWSRFCSDACDKRWRRKNKLYFIEEICPICNKGFQKDKSSPKRFCSISCGAKNSALQRNTRRSEVFVN